MKMTLLFSIILIALVCVVIAMLVFMLRGKLVYDKMNAMFVMNTNIVFMILIFGFIDGRMAMYIDIAMSYSILGFVTTVILAKYIGGRR
ncbi:MAG: monovalent cation/H+ antiporter complex subunit F [Eubacteriales bacterium]|uniref:monovalent cation/H+ antiporter complex subunit F n=1 Tax=Baileyella intestinalis TaxID=2606709 RepID=UPI0023F24772|nr:monovalent cation/H+ antiporter complex subunit F [Baileyella intestinalis]MCI7686511.1 monovalent cation/H+ antiporter complex subunit F [Clostridiales bacterium]MDD5875042.1 monovalent cation/H+ antiporter complex subunit F [Baileyella intestinalis]MDY2995378.1 monovalent cation/H+ antiporter complex subunit F [Baileyella intestinalis]